MSLKRRVALRLESLEDRCLLSGGPIVSQFTPQPQLDVSTVPPNGDQNPYGVVFVPADFQRGGPLHPGDILVSDFNNATTAQGGNLQGNGRTIVRVTPDGHTSVFFQGQPGIGLTTALGILKRGFVIVGNVPSADGQPDKVQPGSLLIIDSHGKKVASIADSKFLDGPWDLTIHDEGDHAQVFVADVLSGTVTRLDLRVPEDGTPTLVSKTQIASGYKHTGDPTAFEIGPTGLAYDPEKDLLYVASTDDNAIYAIAKAKERTQDGGTGHVVYKDNVHLHGPLGLLLAPNDDLIAANGDSVNPDPNQPSELVEFTPKGRFVAQFSIDPSLNAPFGIALQMSHGQITFAAVNDNHNTLEVWRIPSGDHRDLGTGQETGVPAPGTELLTTLGAPFVTAPVAAGRVSGPSRQEQIPNALVASPDHGPPDSVPSLSTRELRRGIVDELFATADSWTAT